MPVPTDVLVLDGGAGSLEGLANLLRRLRYRTVWAKTGEAAHAALLDPRQTIGVAVIPPDLPTLDLGGALRALRSLAIDRRLAFLVTGERPDGEQRQRLRAAGVELALWNPVDPHALRFQINRALAGGTVVRGDRRALRAPVDWPARVRASGRVREARLYSISASGAYLLTPTPCLRKSPLELALSLPSGAATLAARVAMTNVPGNLLRRNLPVGMGVSFEAAPREIATALQHYVEDRYRALSL